LRIIEKFKQELYDNSMLVKIDRQIDHLERQKQRLKVKELSFNSYYEFALQRIPQIMSLEKIDFPIRDFAAILKQFYRGGELEMTLNSDLDANLFDEQFIVFEIDKIKDDPVPFPHCGADYYGCVPAKDAYQEREEKPSLSKKRGKRLPRPRWRSISSTSIRR
jgi:hypothetical protein